jgi:hypothetical protein
MLVTLVPIELRSVDMVPTVLDIVAMPLVALDIELTVPLTLVNVEPIELRLVVSVPTDVCTVANPLVIPVMLAWMAVTVVCIVPTVVDTVATVPLMLVTFAPMAFTVVVKVPSAVEIVAMLPLIATTVALMAARVVIIVPWLVNSVASFPLIATIVAFINARLFFIVVVVSLIVASMPDVLASGSDSTVNVAFAVGVLAPLPDPDAYIATTWSPAWKPTPMKVKLSTPLELAMTPFVVFVNGEKTLSIATKYADEAVKPVPEAANTVFEELA